MTAMLYRFWLPLVAVVGTNLPRARGVARTLNNVNNAHNHAASPLSLNRCPPQLIARHVLQSSAAKDVPAIKRNIAANLRLLTAERAAAMTCLHANPSTTPGEATLPNQAPASSARTSSYAARVAADTVMGTTLPSKPLTKKPKSSGGGAGVLERPAKQIGFVDKKDDKKKFADKFKVMLFNDNGNTREYVARALVQVVGIDEPTAFKIMTKAHKDGMALVGIWAGEVASLYCDQLKSRGIVSETFPVD